MLINYLVIICFSTHSVLLWLKSCFYETLMTSMTQRITTWTLNDEILSLIPMRITHVHGVLEIHFCDVYFFLQIHSLNYYKCETRTSSVWQISISQVLKTRSVAQLDVRSPRFGNTHVFKSSHVLRVLSCVSFFSYLCINNNTAYWIEILR